MEWYGRGVVEMYRDIGFSVSYMKKEVVSLVNKLIGLVKLVFFFFFQAEDGIRDVAVTGVQTCALPISILHLDGLEPGVLAGRLVEVAVDDDRAGQNSSRPLRNSRRPPRGTTTSPVRSTKNRRRSCAESMPISVSAGMMLKRSMIARRSRAPLPTVVWSMTMESSMAAPSFTHTLRPRIELRIVARLTSDASPIWALSTSPPMNRAAGPGWCSLRIGQARLSRSKRGDSPRRSMWASQ